MIEFISYDGQYPCLCGGTLTLKVNDIIRTDFRLCSGGDVWFDDEWEEHISEGKWLVEVPEDLEYLKEEIEEIVNDSVEWGCCGGCI